MIILQIKLSLILFICIFMASRTHYNILKFFFEITQYNADAPNTHAHSPLWTHVHKPYPYEHIRRTERADPDVHEVTTRASLSTGTSPTT